MDRAKFVLFSIFEPINHLVRPHFCLLRWNPDYDSPGPYVRSDTPEGAQVGFPPNNA